MCTRVLTWSCPTPSIPATSSASTRSWPSDGSPGDLLPILSAWLAADDRHAASAATILVRHQEVPTLLAVARSGTGSGRDWAVNALGRLPSEIVEARAGGHLTAELRDELLALWVMHRDWLRGDMHEGLRALSLQTILLDPAEPGLQD